MDSVQFDALVTRLSGQGTRRRILGVLGLLGAAGMGLATESAAKKKKKNKRKKTKRCTPESVAQTCAGTCGSVTNNCKQPVDCGTCGCTPTCNNPTPVCQDRACVACTNSTQCPAGTRCDGGSCTACDVVCTGTPEACGATLRAAITSAAAGATLVVCPGIYLGRFDVERALNLIGAGAGGDAASSTILDGEYRDGVLQNAASVTTTLQAMTIRRGDSRVGGRGSGITNLGDLTLVDVVVTANRNSEVGGSGGIVNIGTLTLRRTRVSGNTSHEGGGIMNRGAVTLEQGSVIGGDRPEDANTATNGGGIYSTDGSVTLASGSRITGNTGHTVGGGIYTTGSVVTLESDSRISGNTAGNQGGGGIFAVSSLVFAQSGALVCDNSGPQCAYTGIPQGGFWGDCPSPTSGVCPG